MINQKTPWDFVEKYYPDYDHAQAIADNDDLCKLMDNEYSIGDASYVLLQKKYSGDREANFLEIEANFKRALCEIYEKSIQNFLNTYEFEDNNMKYDKWTQKADDDYKTNEDF